MAQLIAPITADRLGEIVRAERAKLAVDATDASESACAGGSTSAPPPHQSHTFDTGSSQLRATVSESIHVDTSVGVGMSAGGGTSTPLHASMAHRMLIGLSLVGRLQLPLLERGVVLVPPHFIRFGLLA